MGAGVKESTSHSFKLLPIEIYAKIEGEAEYTDQYHD